MSSRALPFLPALVLAACVPSPFDGLGGDGDYACEGACIEGLEVSLPEGRLHEGPLPEPTRFGDEPVFVDARWVDLEPGEKALEVEVAFATAGAWTLGDFLVEIEGRVYEVATEEATGSGNPSVGSLDACRNLQKQEGYGCTEGCVEACSCVSCSDGDLRSLVVGTCAATCTTYDRQGLVGREPYTSEAVLADYLYNGRADWGLQGMLASRPECDGRKCAGPGEGDGEGTARRRIRFHYGDRSHLSQLDIGTLVAPATPPPDYVPPSGNPAEAATVRVSPCGLCQTTR